VLYALLPTCLPAGFMEGLPASRPPCHISFLIDNVMRMYYFCIMIILDASTLILLARIGLLELFLATFQGKVAIPKKVKSEVCIQGREERPFVESLIKQGKIEVLTSKNPRQRRKLMDDFNIDEGEAEALLVAIQAGAETIATDDRNAIRAAKLLKIDFVTAIAFLIRAHEKQLLDRDEALTKLQRLQAIGRYSNAILKDARNRIEGGE
jgi:predicted nucleic acid-binding protein